MRGTKSLFFGLLLTKESSILLVLVECGERGRRRRTEANDLLLFSRSMLLFFFHVFLPEKNAVTFFLLFGNQSTCHSASEGARSARILNLRVVMVHGGAG